jgi:hypothetical protein
MQRPGSLYAELERNAWQAETTKPEAKAAPSSNRSSDTDGAIVFYGRCAI